MICSGCDDPITADEAVVHADEGQYHSGCEFEEVECTQDTATDQDGDPP